jgi:DNA-binding CsgD family transcriptional regulator
MAGPHGPSETALPLLVAEAQRANFDLASVPLGALVVARAADISLPEYAAVVPTVPLNLRHNELSAIDLVSKGLTPAQAGNVLDVGQRQAEALVAAARRKIHARNNEQATRLYTDLGLMTPLQHQTEVPQGELNITEFIALSLVSRGWKTSDATTLGSGASTFRDYLETACFKLSRSKTNEQAVRRALSFGILAFDRTLIAP